MASNRVSGCLYLLTDLPPMQQDVAESVLGEDVPDGWLQQSLQRHGQPGQGCATQSHILYLVIAYCAQLRPHQVLSHHLHTDVWGKHPSAWLKAQWKPLRHQTLIVYEYSPPVSVNSHPQHNKNSYSLHLQIPAHFPLFQTGLLSSLDILYQMENGCRDVCHYFF